MTESLSVDAIMDAPIKGATWLQVPEALAVTTSTRSSGNSMRSAKTLRGMLSRAFCRPNGYLSSDKIRADLSVLPFGALRLSDRYLVYLKLRDAHEVTYVVRNLMVITAN